MRLEAIIASSSFFFLPVSPLSINSEGGNEAKKKEGGNGRGRKWLPATADDEAAMAAAQIAISQVRLITQKGLHPPTFPEKKIRTSFFTMKKRWCPT